MGPNDGTRFNGGTAQWAENMSLMFTFRGIPCIYYGSEVEFKKGMKVDAGSTDNPVKDSGRAYFGEYLEGSVEASDFGEFTASGNVAKTLDGDLAHHVRRLNMIRAAVPALRKGQYSWDGCRADGGIAFRRAWRDRRACSHQRRSNIHRCSRRYLSFRRKGHNQLESNGRRRTDLQRFCRIYEN